MDRRKFVKIAGVSAAVGVAGCLNGDEPPENGDDDDDDNDEEVVFEDMTGQEAVTVDAEAVDFVPENVEVSVGTTVTWEWVNIDQGGHNVVHEPGEELDDTGADEPLFMSDDGDIINEVGHTWSYTFDEPGTYYYVCEPHVALGMVGHVRVVENGVNGEDDDMNGEENGDDNGEE